MAHGSGRVVLKKSRCLLEVRNLGGIIRVMLKEGLRRVGSYVLGLF